MKLMFFSALGRTVGEWRLKVYIPPTTYTRYCTVLYLGPARAKRTSKHLPEGVAGMAYLLGSIEWSKI